MVTLEEYLKAQEDDLQREKMGFSRSFAMVWRILEEGESPELKEYLEQMRRTPEYQERKKRSEASREAFMNSPEMMELRRELEQEQKK